MSNKFHTYSFEKLETWQLARWLRLEIYNLTTRFPSDEKYGLTNQIRRSVNSISDNIAEGSGRITKNDKAYFTNMAYASCLEVINQIITAFDLEFISEDEYTSLRTKMDKLSNLLNGLYKYQLKAGQDLKNKIINDQNDIP